MNPFEMVVLIVAIVAIAGVMRARFTHRAEQPEIDPDALRMKDEIRTLKERIAVLERIATENDRSHTLDREIERLRDRS